MDGYGQLASGSGPSIAAQPSFSSGMSAQASPNSIPGLLGPPAQYRPPMPPSPAVPPKPTPTVGGAVATNILPAASTSAPVVSAPISQQIGMLGPPTPATAAQKQVGLLGPPVSAQAKPMLAPKPPVVFSQRPPSLYAKRQPAIAPLPPTSIK